MNRKSGILLHISSLPSPYGIGTLGKSAYAFADFLSAAGQSYWQLLPLGPTSVFDSPYQSFSTCAGNPYFIDLDLLCEDGLLTPSDYSSLDFGDVPAKADYGKLYRNRYAVLRKAYEQSKRTGAGDLDAFAAEKPWLADYALFMALKSHFGGEMWTKWPDADIRTRKPKALAYYRELLCDEIRFQQFMQLCFFAQWERLRAYVREKGIRFIGDLPIYVPLDSADVWVSPQLFQLDGDLQPVAVAGVPPDYFSADGQLWGNPLYDWDAMRREGYRWWIDRVRAASALYDTVRIDHFRGLASYWRVPAGEETARNGQWVEGPGVALIDALTAAIPELSLIAEDLGFLTEDVMTLLSNTGLPGMKVIQFAFDSREESDYLPHNYSPHCVCYTGTHDNTTAAGWFDEASPADVQKAVAYLGLNERETYHYGLIRAGMSSVAELFITQMQDYLGLGSEGRMNTPGTVGHGNWCYRLQPGELTSELAQRIRAMTELYGRL